MQLPDVTGSVGDQAVVLSHREAEMDRALRTGGYLAAAMLGMSLLMLLVGLGMAARPEVFVALGLDDTAKVGLAVALTAGLGVLASTMLGRVLRLLEGNLGGNGEPSDEL